MEKISILIVEDKLLVAQDIAGLLRKHDFNVCAICQTGEEAIRKAEQEKPDLILMDIELSGPMDGIAAASEITRKQAIPIIYLSDFTDKRTIDRAKPTHPANYLAKPFNESDLIRAIDLAFSNAKQSNKYLLKPNEHIFVRVDNQAYIKLLCSEILYLKADRAYCTVVTEGKSYKLSTSMNHINEQLDHPDFLKVHRSFIINTTKITALDGNTIKFNDQEVQMSREYRDILMSRVKILK